MPLPPFNDADYYTMLGVARTSAVNEILRAFRARAQKAHPDKHPTEGPAATERMKALLRAQNSGMEETDHVPWNGA